MDEEKTRELAIVTVGEYLSVLGDTQSLSRASLSSLSIFFLKSWAERDLYSRRVKSSPVRGDPGRPLWPLALLAGLRRLEVEE